MGSRGNTIASELFYDLLATSGLMIIGVRRCCPSTGKSYV